MAYSVIQTNKADINKIMSIQVQKVTFIWVVYHIDPTILPFKTPIVAKAVGKPYRESHEKASYAIYRLKSHMALRGW